MRLALYKPAPNNDRFSAPSKDLGSGDVARASVTGAQIQTVSSAGMQGSSWRSKFPGTNNGSCGRFWDTNRQAGLGSHPPALQVGRGGVQRMARTRTSCPAHIMQQ